MGRSLSLLTESSLDPLARRHPAQAVRSAVEAAPGRESPVSRKSGSMSRPSTRIVGEPGNVRAWATAGSEALIDSTGVSGASSAMTSSSRARAASCPGQPSNHRNSTRVMPDDPTTHRNVSTGVLPRSPTVRGAGASTSMEGIASDVALGAEFVERAAPGDRAAVAGSWLLPGPLPAGRREHAVADIDSLWQLSRRPGRYLSIGPA